MSVGMSVVSKMRRRDNVAHAHARSHFWKVKTDNQTELQGLKTEEERLRIRRENKKTENHKKQRLTTLKRLKRGDDNELERNLRLEKVVTTL